jgi:formylglycine-generating enzyme required for sulfatase activity
MRVLAAASLAVLAFAACSTPPADDTVCDAESDLSTASAPLAGGSSASCTGKGAGLTTCGAGSESCCASIALDGTTKLDKFQVTAGRMRAFVNATNGNVKSWYQNAKATLRADAVAQLDPYVSYLPSNLGGHPNGAYDQLGGFIYLPHEPSSSQGCFVGDAGNPGYGSHTYPLPKGTEQETRGLTAGQLASKALNCVAYPLAAAFCAWDGGRLQTKAEHDAAWGAGVYPWGAAPIPGGYAMVGGQWTLVSSVTGQPCPTCDTTHVDWKYSYQFPAQPLNGATWDYAIYILEPGRLAAGHGPMGHADVAGNLMELTATFDGTNTKTTDYAGKQVTQPNVRWTKNGSWEGHGIGFDGWSFPIMTKYGKTGVRCAR